METQFITANVNKESTSQGSSQKSPIDNDNGNDISYKSQTVTAKRNDRFVNKNINTVHNNYQRNKISSNLPTGVVTGSDKVAPEKRNVVLIGDSMVKHLQKVCRNHRT